MRIKFSVGAAALEAAQDLVGIIDRFSVEGPFVVIDFGDASDTGRATIFDMVRESVTRAAAQTPPGPQQSALLSLATQVAAQESTLAAHARVSTDTHAEAQKPSPDQESHSLPTGDATTSNASQHSDANTNEENEDGQAPQQPTEPLEAVDGGRAGRRGRNRR